MSKRTIKQIKDNINSIFPKIESDARIITGNVDKLNLFFQGVTIVAAAPQVTLQEATQKYQQCLQAFSTLLKSYWDTTSNKNLNSLILKTQSDISNLSRKLTQLESYTVELKSVDDTKQEKQLADFDTPNALKEVQELWRMALDLIKQTKETQNDIIRHLMNA